MKTKEINLGKTSKEFSYNVELTIKSLGFSMVYIIFVIIICSLFKIETKIIGLILIFSGVYWMYMRWLDKNNYFLK